MKKLILSLILFISLVNTKSINACGWSDDYTQYLFFKSNYFVSNQFSPLFYSATPWDAFWFTEKNTQSDNIDEWFYFFNKTLSKESIKTIVYRTKINAIEKGLYNYSHKNKKHFIAYIKFAKSCEPICNNKYYWDKPEIDLNKIKVLLNEGIKEFNKCSNNFLKLRYGFQVLKLYRYAEKYEELKKFYENSIAKISSKSIIKYWSMDHYAGALLKLGYDAKAAYLFSKVFRNCKSRRYSSYYSFNVYNTDQWNKVKAMCKNNNELYTLYFLRAINKNSIPLEEIKKMIEISPNSEMIETLIIKEINKIESNIFTQDLNKNYLINSKNILNKDVKIYIKKMQSLIDVVLQKSPINKEFYIYCQQYLKLLNKDFNITLPQNGKYKKAYSTLSILAKLLSTQKIDTESENYFYQKLIIENKDISDFIGNYFERYYKNTCQKGKEFLCNKRIYDLYMNPDIDVVYDLKKIIKEQNKTNFVKKRLSSYKSKFTLVDILNEVEGTIHFSKFSLNKAITCYEKLSPYFRKNSTIFNIKTNPFNIAIDDCINCKNRSRAKNNKLKAAKLMLKLAKLTSSEPNNAMNYFLLANAYYNITYFGRSWNIISYYRSSAQVSKFRSFVKPKLLYQKTVEITTDKELKAKATFMLAKCEQHEYFCKNMIDESGWYSSWRHYNKFNKTENHKTTSGYRSYFKKLKDNYNDTKYYQEVIRECSYFRNWLSKN